MKRPKKAALRVVAFPDRREEPAWSPIELLENFLIAVKSGKERPQNLFVAWFEQTEHGTLRPCWWNAGCTQAERIALLEVQKAALLEQWRD